MKSTKDVVACVRDDGRFLPVALRLAKDFEKVYYAGPRSPDCPSVTRDMIGANFDEQNLFRVDSIAQVKASCDLIVFPDVGHTYEQLDLLNQGFSVWGPGAGEALEVYRGAWLDALGKMNLPLPKCVRIIGLSWLRKYLRDQEDKYIKISKWRGDFETLHYRSWKEDEGTLDYYAVKFGPLKESITFYVFDPIETTIEDGIDTHCVGGELPRRCLHAMEKKDQALLATFADMDDIAREVAHPMEALASHLKRVDYRGPVSSEVRITEDHQSFFIDPTLRYGSPPHQLQTELIGNFGDIVWRGANGECVEPEPVAKFGAQAIIKIEGEENQWDEIQVPDEIRQWIKVGFAVQAGGKFCIPPGLASHAIWLTAIGDTIKETIDNLISYAKQLPDGLDCRYHGLADLLKEVEHAEKEGMEFTPQEVPQPSSVWRRVARIPEVR